MMLPTEERGERGGAVEEGAAPRVSWRRRYRRVTLALEALAMAITAWWLWLNAGTGWALLT